MTAIFKPFRALGQISTGLPIAVQRRGKETFVHVSAGRAWQVYNTAKLLLALVGPEMEGEIDALACKDDLTFAAIGGTMIEFRRMLRCGSYRSGDSTILQMLVLGEVLLSLSADGNLQVWKIGEYEEPQLTLNLGKGFQPTCMAHPDTYINKVVVGSKSGKLELWNFVSGKRLFAFDFGTEVCCIAPSPALDVVGVGLADGRAILHNLKFDEQVATFANASGAGAKTSLFLSSAGKASSTAGPCTALAFRTGQGVPLMAAGGTPGVITIWNLESRRLQTVIRDAHDGPLVSLHFFAGEPRLMSSAQDNSLKQWVFDQPDGTGRLLRFRSGHSASPAVVRSYGDGNRILSAGTDRAFRVFSTIQDQQSRELSQGHIQSRAKRLKVEQSELKLPPVTAMHACQVRERDWANVVTAHADDSAAYTWRLQNFCLGEHVLRPPSDAKKGALAALPTPVTCVAVSSCGNFGLVGSQSGRLDRYNLQSGLHRGSYQRSSPLSKDTENNSHNGAVVGVASDGANCRLTSCGEDGFLRLWGFKSRRLQDEIELESRPTRMAAHPSNSLIAIADAQFQLKMYDVATKRRVRSFTGHLAPITDLSLSTDGRWLMSSSEDGTFRVWDIPSARILQVLRLGAPVASFSLSLAQELLATCHPENKGIYLWANSCVFAGTADIVPSDRLIDAHLPSMTADLEEGEGLAGDAVTDAPPTPDLHRPDASSKSLPTQYGRVQDSGAPAPLAPRLITFSLLPKSQWQNLVHLEAIKERSRPEQPPKKPEAAPFFLPTVSTLARNPVFATEIGAEPNAMADGSGSGLPGWGGTDGSEGEADAAEATEEMSKRKRKRLKKDQRAAEDASRILQNAVPAVQESDFLIKLRKGRDLGDFSECISLLRNMSAVAVDQQLSSMQVTDGDDSNELAIEDLFSVLQMVEMEVAAGQSYEHIQAFLKAYLTIHGESISEHEGLRQRANEVQLALSESWNRLGGKLQKVKCLLGFLGNLPT